MFVLILCTLIAAVSSFIGSISGIGGGIIIKPVLDITGSLSIDTVNFTSGVTVLTMSTVSLFRHFLSVNATERRELSLREGSRTMPRTSKNAFPKVNVPQVLTISFGSILGGLIGNQLFEACLIHIKNQQVFILAQAVIILAITILVLLYQYNKQRIRTLNLKHPLSNLICGFFLGLISAFLGIGGGPLNVAALVFLFGMNSKSAALSSHAIIFFSQMTSLIATLTANKSLDFNMTILILMMLGAVVASLLGRFFAGKMNEQKTSVFFTGTLWLVFVINLTNVIRQWVSLY